MSVRIDIITVVTSPPSGLNFTRKSVVQLHNENPLVRWIVIVGKTDEIIENELLRAGDDLGPNLIRCNQKGKGIYGAMNEAMDLSESNFFIFLNSGDIAHPELTVQLTDINSNKVHCFKSSWHNSTGITLNVGLTNKRISYSFAKMPNHQAMVFPAKFRNCKYDEELPIAADQDMKLSLHKSHLLEFHDETVVSSLLGGVSASKLNPHEVKSRYFESRKIFLRHYNRAWAEFISLLYGIRFVARVNYSFKR